MKRLSLFSFFFLLYFSSVGMARAEDASVLFFSEYIEGSGNNKALEIYNPSDLAIELLGYKIEMYFNGNASVGRTINLEGTIEPNDVFVLAHNLADATILAEADLTGGGGWYNGNDFVSLRDFSGNIVDSIGQLGVDPGDGIGWGSEPTNTADNTLSRKCEISIGDYNDSDIFDPSVEWDGYPVNTFVNLGEHVLCLEEDADGDGVEDSVDNCPLVANEEQEDSDGDVVGDVCDNCMEIANPNQMDTDMDGTGDVCELPTDTTNPTIVSATSPERKTVEILFDEELQNSPDGHYPQDADFKIYHDDTVYFISAISYENKKVSVSLIDFITADDNLRLYIYPALGSLVDLAGNYFNDGDEADIPIEINWELEDPIESEKPERKSSGGRAPSPTKTLHLREIVGCGERIIGYSTETGEPCAENIVHNEGEVLGATSFYFSRTLSQGMEGEEVFELHRKLNTLGYYFGVIDNQFGSLLKKALIEFQTANGLKADGIVGPETRVFLNS